jgi:hypothetical protein
VNLLPVSQQEAGRALQSMRPFPLAPSGSSLGALDLCRSVSQLVRTLFTWKLYVGLGFRIPLSRLAAGLESAETESSRLWIQRVHLQDKR